MSRSTLFWRSTPGGEGVNDVQITAKTIAGATLDTAPTAGVGADKGMVTLDVGYPGPHYFVGVKDGVTLMSSSRDFGFAGTFSLYDLPDAFMLWSDGVIAGKDNACAVSTNGATRSVDVATGTIMGLGHPFTVRTSTNVLITANASGNPRKDLIVARFYPRDTTDEGKWELAAVAGTPAASPVAPSPTQSAAVWEIPLSVVTVANGAASFTSGNLADAREYASVAVEIADVNGLVAALAAKAPLASPTFTGTVDAVNLDVSGTVVVGGNDLTAELGFLNAATSSLQTQLNAKAPSASPTFTGTVTLPASIVVPDGALAQADVSGLVAALAAKLGLSGGTLSGDGLMLTVEAATGGVDRIGFQTTGFAGKGALHLPNGTPLVGWSDQYGTQMFALEPDTGNIGTAGNLSADGNLTAGNADTDLHTLRGRVKAAGTSPSISQGDGAGSGLITLTLSGTDTAGSITLVAGTAPVDDSTVLTVTFATAKGNTNYAVVLTPASINAGRDIAKIRINKANGSFAIACHDPLVAGATYNWDYHVFEYEP